MQEDVIRMFENRLLEVYESAQNAFGIVLELPSLSFERMGTKAGLAIYSRNHIAINYDFFASNLRDMLYKTLPHEAAHLISFRLYGAEGKGHGPRWKSVMRRLGLEPERCHSYDVSNARLRRTVKFKYVCPSCKKDYDVGPAIHRRASTGHTKYYCKCKTEIVFKGA